MRNITVLISVIMPTAMVRTYAHKAKQLFYLGD